MSEEYVNYTELEVVKAKIDSKFTDMLANLQRIKGNIVSLMGNSFRGDAATTFEDTYSDIETAIKAEQEKFNQELNAKLTGWYDTMSEEEKRQVQEFQKLQYSGK